MENNLIPFETEADKCKEIVDGINSSVDYSFVSFNPESTHDKVMLYNAMTEQGERVKDYVNKVIDIVDVIISPVNVDGEVVPRCILLKADGKTVCATSWGVYRSLQRINALFGQLHFDEGLKVTPVEVKTKKGQTINLKIV